MNDFLKKEDWEEPRCLLNMHPETERIPVRRVLEKLDAFLSRNDYEAAERHLAFWVAEADAGNDSRGKLTLLNEQIGLYRKLGREREAMQAVDAALSLAATMDMEGSVTFGTTLINAATAYKAFGRAEEALPLYRKARVIYESGLRPEDDRLGGLYNNMALALTELGSFREAEDLFGRALTVMAAQEHGQAEAAITWLNLADLVTAEEGPEAGEEKVFSYLEKAEALLNTESIPRDGNYAYVCEKCAPVFGYYGWFLFEKELAERARAIYERA